MSSYFFKHNIKFTAIIFATCFAIGALLFFTNDARAAVSIRNVGVYVNGTANLTPVIPATAASGDMMILAYGTKPYNDAPTIDQGWTSIGFATDGTVAAGNNTGSMQTRIYYKIHTGSEINPTITNTTNNVSGAVIIVFQKGASEVWEIPVGAGGGDATANTTFSVTASSNPGITSGDMLVGYAAIRSNAGTQSGISITATGVTVGAFTESPAADLATAAGGNMAMSGGYSLVTAGTATAAPVYTSTLAAAHTGSAFIVRLRATTPPAVPTITSPTVTSITTNGATLGANVTSLGFPASISARGTCWGTSPSPTINCLAEGGTTTGIFSHARTGMSPSTFYYYRGYATNSTGTGYSADGTFTTAAPASGTISASPSTCTILSGASTCTVPFTWSITNATSPNLYNSTTATTYSTAASGTGVSYPITNGSNTVQVRNSTTVLASTTATGSCTSGTTWNGSMCATVNTSPTLSISQPDGVSDTVTAGTPYNITYSLSDAEQTVTSAFYYDTNNSGLDGTAITGACATAPEGSGVVCSWSTSGVTPGSYYIYGLTSDGIAPQVSAYSPGMITITTPPASGTVSVSPSTCTILSEASTCTVPFTWSTTNATSPNLYNSTTANQYSTLASGTSVSYPITNGLNTVQVRDGSTVLNSTTATGSCDTGTSWNGSICALVVTYYDIFASSGPNGSVTPTGTTTVAQGSSQLYNITPNANYGVATLLIDGGSVATSTTYTFTNVQANHTISATFYLLPITHTIVSSAGSNGTIVPLGSVSVADHGSQAFSINPDSGFTIETLVVDSVSIATSTSYTFSDVTTDHTISVTFALIPPPPGSFTIIANQNPNGTIVPSGSTVVTEGNSQTYTITPNSGYEISTLIIDSISVATSTSYTFTNVTSNHTIEATYTLIQGSTATLSRIPRQATVIFTGMAYPGAVVSIVDKELANEQTVKQEQILNQSSGFEISFKGIIVGSHAFALVVRDKDGRRSQSKFYQADISKEEFLLKELILMPPTIEVLNGQISRGKNVDIIGYASPYYIIDLELDGILTKGTVANPDGTYHIILPTGSLSFGKHVVRVKQSRINERSGSDFSISNTFIVSNLPVVKTDFNGDGKIDISDWSIFLARFISKNDATRKSIDLTGDGKVDISDFSIFIKTIRKK